MNEAWLDQDNKVFSYEPQPAGTIRVNYYRTDGNYDKKSLWYWGDVKNPSSGEWPNGYHGHSMDLCKSIHHRLLGKFGYDFLNL